MLERLKRIFHRRSRRRKERDLDKHQEAPRQDSPIHKKESHRSELGAHHPIQKTQSTVLGTRSAQTKSEAEFTAPRYPRDADVSGGRAGEDGLPVVRPLSHEPGPHSNVQQIQHEMPTRDSGSSVYYDGSVSPGSPPGPGAELVDEARPAPLKPNKPQERGPDIGLERGSESHGDAAVDVDYTLDSRKPVTHETIHPHVHTIYEPRRTRSIHYEEHHYYIQPIIDTSADSSGLQPAVGAGQSNLVRTE